MTPVSNTSSHPLPQRFSWQAKYPCCSLLHSSSRQAEGCCAVPSLHLCKIPSEILSSSHPSLAGGELEFLGVSLGWRDGGFWWTWWVLVDVVGFSGHGGFWWMCWVLVDVVGFGGHAGLWWTCVLMDMLGFGGHDGLWWTCWVLMDILGSDGHAGY